ncbi:unnamed protein product [Soboliphyme baturini]|uniref:Uncharacterized protein n=1 Tax=Soboliphyme baturini TaxID=241478 RepID=A0A183IXZ2_9BILA|nr:unnamed protein product [Soboliphyme baturini]
MGRAAGIDEMSSPPEMFKRYDVNDAYFEETSLKDSNRTRITVTADLQRSPLSAEASLCNAALYTSVSDALNQLTPYPTRTLPVNIPKPHNAEHDGGDNGIPPVPPCTPCSPLFWSSMQQQQQQQQNLRENVSASIMRGTRSANDQLMDDQ